MAQPVTPADLKHMLDTQRLAPALTYENLVNTTVRISLAPAWYHAGELEISHAASGTYQGTLVVVLRRRWTTGDARCSHPGGMGYRHVHVLDGGMNLWTTMDYATEWGVNVPSKDFGRRWSGAPCAHHRPRNIRPPATRRKIILLDSRTRKNTGAPRSRAAVVARAVSWRCVFSRWCPIQTRSGRPLCRAHAQAS